MIEDAITAQEPPAPDIDENGVDLTQIRAMLDLPPAERLTRAADFMNDLLALRARNERSGAR